MTINWGRGNFFTNFKTLEIKVSPKQISSSIDQANNLLNKIRVGIYSH